MVNILQEKNTKNSSSSKSTAGVKIGCLGFLLFIPVFFGSFFTCLYMCPTQNAKMARCGTLWYLGNPETREYDCKNYLKAGAYDFRLGDTLASVYWGASDYGRLVYTSFDPTEQGTIKLTLDKTSVESVTTGIRGRNGVSHTSYVDVKISDTFEIPCNGITIPIATASGEYTLFVKAERCDSETYLVRIGLYQIETKRIR